MRTKNNFGKKVVPFVLAMAVAGTAVPVYTAPSVIVKAAQSGAFGSGQVKLDAGTYNVPVSLKKASDITADSMAGGCVEKTARLTVNKDKTASLELNLTGLTIMGTDGNAANIKVFKGNSAEGDTIDVKILEGSEEFPTKVSFDIPEGQLDKDGVYISMDIMSGSGKMMTQSAYLAIDYSSLKGNDNTSTDETKENSAHISQFGGYDVKTKVTVSNGKVKDLVVEGSNFEGEYKDQNENTYLKKAVDKITSQVKGLSVTDQTSFDNIDVVSGATTTAQVIKNSVMESLGLEVKDEVIPDAPTQKLQAGTYSIQVKNTTDTVEHSLSGGTGEKKVTATLYVDQDGKMQLSYPLISNTKEEPLSVLEFNGYYDSENNCTKDGIKVIKDGDVVTNVIMPLSGSEAKQTYKTNVRLYVPSMSNLNGEMSGITFENGKFNIDSTLTLYWDTLNKTGDLNNQYLSDGIYKIDAKMLKATGSDTSMANDAITHKVKMTVKDGKYYLTLNFKAMNIPMNEKKIHGFLRDIKYIDNGVAKDVTVESVQKDTNGTVVKDDFGTNYPDIVTFPMIDSAVETGVVPMQVQVPVMESIMAGMGTQKVNLTLDWTSAVKTTANDKAFASEDVIEQGPKKDNTTTKPATKPTTQTKVKVAKVTGVKAKNTAKKTATVSWKKVKGASGYVVYRATKKNGKYKSVKKISKGSTVKYVNKKLTKKKTYYYKVRAFKKSGKKVVYGAYSNKVSVKIKK